MMRLGEGGGGGGDVTNCTSKYKLDAESEGLV